MQWYLKVLSEYVNFRGRAHRREYWMFVLFHVLILVGLAVVDGLVGTMGLLQGVYNLAVLLPSLGVTVRRLHDTNRTGWWVLVSLIPLLGLLVLLVFMVLKGDERPNEYGPVPPAQP